MSNSIKILDKITSKTKIYLFIILLLIVLLCIYEPQYIIPSGILYILLLIYTFWANGRKKNEFFKHIQELTFDVDSAARSTLINSPFPLIIIETDGNIVWKNNKFVREFINVNINTYLEEILKEVKQEIINNGNKTIDKQIEIDVKTYNVKGEYLRNKGEKNGEKKYITTLYFIDNTENREILKKYEESKTCVGLIMIDNYEELMQRIPTQEMAQVVASVEKEIYGWAEPFECLIIKKTRDTFVCVFENRYLRISNDVRTFYGKECREEKQILCYTVTTGGDKNGMDRSYK